MKGVLKCCCAAHVVTFLSERWAASGGERWAAHLVGVDRHLVAIAEVRRARAAGLQAREQQQR
jgi:hypothetical protein